MTNELDVALFASHAFSLNIELVSTLHLVYFGSSGNEFWRWSRLAPDILGLFLFLMLVEQS
jgi:hypothetical protein